MSTRPSSRRLGSAQKEAATNLLCGATFAGEATNVGLTWYWVCKEWKTDYYGHHCVKRVQDCKMSQQGNVTVTRIALRFVAD